MVQNRNKLIKFFISHISNVIVHDILEKAIDSEETIYKYQKELKNSFDIAKIYRSKINPVDYHLPEKDFTYIKTQIIAKVKSELNSRISKGYQNINLELVEETVDKYLKEMKISED